MNRVRLLTDDPLCRSFDVITCHENVYIHSSWVWQNRDRAVCEMSVCLSWHDAFADGLTWPICVFHKVRSFYLTQGEIFALTFRGQNAYVPMRLDTRNTCGALLQLGGGAANELWAPTRCDLGWQVRASAERYIGHNHFFSKISHWCRVLS